MDDITAHYSSSRPLAKLAALLDQVAPGGGPVTFEQLGGFDDFHTGGRKATVRMAELLSPSRSDTVLDAGCGIGGPARYLAATTGCKVVGVDVTPEFIDAARLLNERTGMMSQVEFRVADITKLDVADATFDHIWMQHVAMNIANREGLYAEMRRVIKPGGRFASYDVVDGGWGELVLPVPWATRPEHSYLVTPERLRGQLEAAGFRIDVWQDPTKEWVPEAREILDGPSSGARPLFGPGIFIDDIRTKGAAYFRNMAERRTSLVLAVCTAV